MQLSISYHWLKEFLPGLTSSPEEVARRLSLHAFSVDRVTRFGDGLEKIVIGRVVKIEPHLNADKLRIANTEIGSPKGRRSNLAQIVCGGVNLREGMTVAVTLPGAKVRWHGEGDLVELKPTEIRGVRSGGMICAASEIGLFDYFPHKEREIMDLTAVTDAKPGTPIAKALGLDDVIFEIEVTTNRPDGMSVVGLAREVGAIFGVSLKTNGVASDSSRRRGLSSATPIRIDIVAPKLCPRYQAAHLRNVTVAPSPWWMQKRLIGAGIRPINNVVDITNYVMWETGQPMHAFDYGRIADSRGLHADQRGQFPRESASSQRKSALLVVRTAKAGETLKALDGETYMLAQGMLVIADAERPIAIAGVMGGEETGVTGKTKEIIFESATFDPLSVRRTARALNLHSDSSVRFEKGLSTESTAVALSRAVQLAQELAHAELAHASERRAKPYRPRIFTLRPDEVNALIGVEIPAKRQVAILKSLGLSVSGSGKVTVPYFRDHDIESDRDLAEEVARIHGYHALPAVLPQGEIPVREKNKTIVWEDRIREVLVGDGYAEIFTYSMLSTDLLCKTNYQPEKCLRIANPLSVDLEYMRPSLIPCALQVIAENEPRFPADRIFEVSHVYLPRPNDLPIESTWCIGAIWAPWTPIMRDTPSLVSIKQEAKEFFAAKGMLEAILQKYNVAYLFKKYESHHDIWHPARTLVVQAGGSRRSSAGATEEHLGTVGEIHPAILERFGIKGRVAIFEFALRPFIDAALPVATFEPISEFPSVKRDIAFVVPERTLYARVVDAIRGFNPLIVDAELFDVYHGDAVGKEKKSFAFHLTYRAADRTLKAEEAEAVHEGLGKMLEKEFGAAIRV